MAISSASGKLLAYSTITATTDFLNIPNSSTDYTATLGKETIATIRVCLAANYTGSQTYVRCVTSLYDGTNTYIISDIVTNAASNTVTITDEIKGIIIPPGYKIKYTGSVMSGGGTVTGSIIAYGFEE